MRKISDGGGCGVDIAQQKVEVFLPADDPVPFKILGHVDHARIKHFQLRLDTLLLHDHGKLLNGIERIDTRPA